MTGLQNVLLKRKVLLSAIAGATVVALGVLIVASRSSKPAQAAPRPLDVEVVRVEQRTFPSTANGSGRPKEWSMPTSRPRSPAIS